MKTLILSPHIDDEVLGAYSFLGPDTHVCYFGVEERPLISRAKRMEELRQVARSLAFDWQLLDFEVNHYCVDALITPIEQVIKEVRPMTLLLPAGTSYNQDHRAVYLAGMTASRPHDTNWFVPNVLAYEQPHVFLSPMEQDAFNIFHGIDIDAKVEAYAMYASQVRGHRSPEILRALAFLRGAQAGLPAAEAFSARRLRLGRGAP